MADKFVPTPKFFEELQRILPLLKYRVGEREPGSWWPEQNPYDPTNDKDSLVYELLRQHFEMTPEEWDKLLNDYPDVDMQIWADGNYRMMQQGDGFAPGPKKAPKEPKDKSLKDILEEYLDDN